MEFNSMQTCICMAYAWHIAMIVMHGSIYMILHLEYNDILRNHRSSTTCQTPFLGTCSANAKIMPNLQQGLILLRDFYGLGMQEMEKPGRSWKTIRLEKNLLRSRWMCKIVLKFDQICTICICFTIARSITTPYQWAS